MAFKAKSSLVVSKKFKRNGIMYDIKKLKKYDSWFIHINHNNDIIMIFLPVFLE